MWKYSPKIAMQNWCTTTNLPLCNDTIIVSKITLLYSVSVITNFVIPKRDRQTDRQTDRQKNTLLRLQPARDPTIPAILGMVIVEVRPIFVPLTLFDPISSFATRGY